MGVPCRVVEGACTRAILIPIRVTLATGATEQCVKCGGTVDKAEGCKFGPKTYHIKCLCCSQCGELPSVPPLSHTPATLSLSSFPFLHSFISSCPPVLPLLSTFFISHPSLNISLSEFLSPHLFSPPPYLHPPPSLPSLPCPRPLPYPIYSCCLTRTLIHALFTVITIS